MVKIRFVSIWCIVFCIGVMILFGCGPRREFKQVRYPNGQLSEQYYVIKDNKGNYLRDGKYLMWYENGQKKAETTFKAEKPEGLYTAWYDNGRKMEEGTYKDGLPEGPVTMWYENGQKKLEGTFRGGKENGHFTYYQEDGRKKVELVYKDGQIVK